MLTAVKATYENGQIIWHEQPPVRKKTEVVVTFLDGDPTQPPITDGAVRLGATNKRQGGRMKGQIHITDDLNEHM